MTNKTSQAQWVESDGVSNLPTAEGCYRVRCHRDHSYEWHAYFDGERFCAASSGGQICAADYHTQGIHSDQDWVGTNARYGSDNHCDAWWDYQGLMSKPVRDFCEQLQGSVSAELIAYVHGSGTYRNDRHEEQSRFEDWMYRECPFGDVSQVQYAWTQSSDYADMIDAQNVRNKRRATAIQPSDEPGIQRAKYAAKFNDKPELVVTMVNGIECDPVALTAFLDSQRPNPAPNTTPRGIMAVWNEAADHRLGQWNQTGNFAD